MTSLLAGVDQSIFHNVFAVGLSEMQHLGTLSDTEAAHQLYGLASGADRVSIAGVSRQLETARRRLLDDPDAVAAIGQLTERRAELQREAARQIPPTDRWFKLNEERQKITDELQQLELRKGEFGHHIDGAKPNQTIRSQWQACRKLQQQLDAIGPIPDIPHDALNRLNKLASDIGTQRAAWEALREKRRQLKVRAGGVKGNAALLQHAEPIDALRKQRTAIADAVQEIEQQTVKLEELEFELHAEMERLGIKAGWHVGSLPMITNEMIAALRGPARSARDARRQLEAIDEQRKLRFDNAEGFRTKLDGVLRNTPHDTVTDLLEDARQQVDHLKQRIELDNRLVKLQRNQQEAREEASYWTQRQVLPWRGLMLIGALFTLGIVVALVALFGSTFGIASDQRLMVAVVGGAISMGALIIKNVASFAASKSLESCREELGELQEQIEELNEQTRKLELNLPASSEPLAVLLQNKQDELTKLLKLEPIESQRLAEIQQAEAAEDQKRHFEAALKTARRAWRDSLRALDLPDGITPTQFRQLSHADGKLGRLRESHAKLSEQLEGRRQEIDGLRQRTQLVAERVGLQFDADSLEAQIEELAEGLQVARQRRQDRDSLHRNWRQLGREQEKIARNAKRMTEKKRVLVEKYGVIDTQDLKSIVKRQKQSASLQTQRDELLREIADQLGPCCKQEELVDQLVSGGFESQLSKLESEHQHVSSRVAKLLERRGELNIQLKNLSKDRQHSIARLEEGEVERQIKQQIQSWATLAGISRALDSVRTSYESDRQPETLAEASGYLKRLTSGRYRRIWTPFGESSLCVDDENKKTFHIESLSRGTREQVFLSLRLALAAAYSRRGAALPIILDDVFVNFDAKRAHAAAETVCEFAAAGHQVLVFTCHDHIHDVFLSLDVDVRTLPSAEQVVSEGVAVLPDQATPRMPVVDDVVATVPANDDDAYSDVDPELDYELMYGAPEYDPGYEPPVNGTSVRRVSNSTPTVAAANITPAEAAWH